MKKIADILQNHIQALKVLEESIECFKNFQNGV